MKRITTAALLGAALITTAAYAQDETKTLSIGDDAPAIEVSHWLKGTPVEKFEKGKVYVVEFWATWCGPCRASMPHISELQEEYKDYNVQFLGISDEVLPTVVGFLVKDDAEGKQWFDKMAYTVATDPDRSVYKDYMVAAGQNGIPTAFIVGKTGKIEWIGHPMNIEEPIKAVVNDSWDRVAEMKKFEEQEKAQSKLQALMQSIQEADAQGDWEKAVKIIDQVIAMGDEYAGFKVYKFQLMATSDDGSKEAYEYGEQLVKENWDDAQALNAIAWFIVDNNEVKNPDYGFALKVAKRASELTDDADPSILDTYAHAFYKKGDFKNAVLWEQKAVDNLADNEGPMANDLKKALEEFKKESGN